MTGVSVTGTKIQKKKNIFRCLSVKINNGYLEHWEQALVQLRGALKDQGTLARRDSLAPKEVGNLYFSSGNFVDNLSEEVSSLDNLGSEAGSTLC